MTPEDASRAFRDTAQRLVAVNAARKALISQVSANASEAATAREVAQDWHRAADVLRSFSDDASARLRSDIETLVSHGLQTVFEDPTMAFHVTTRVLRGQTSVEFSLTSRGVTMPVPGAHGGGVLEVIAFVLRVVVTMLAPGVRKVLILDEPFSHVSADYRPRLAAFLRELCDATPLQLLLVTHDDATPEVADVHVQLANVAGEAKVARGD